MNSSHDDLTAPDKRTGEPARRRSIWRALVAVLVAFSLVAVGVVVSIAVLSGPQVRADDPLPPAQVGPTPTASTSADPALTPSVADNTVTIPLAEGGHLELSVHNAYIYDESAAGFDPARYEKALGGYLPGHFGFPQPYLIVEGTLTNRSGSELHSSSPEEYQARYFQAFSRDAAGKVSRQSAKVSGNPLTRSSYYQPSSLNPGVANQLVLAFPLEDKARPAELGIAPETGWTSQAAWLTISNLVTDGPTVD